MMPMAVERNESVNLLLTHAQVMQEMQRLYMQRMWWQHRIQEGGFLVTRMGLTCMGIYMQLPMEFTGGVLAATVSGVGGLTWFNDGAKMHELEMQLTSPRN